MPWKCLFYCWHCERKNIYSRIRNWILIQNSDENGIRIHNTAKDEKLGTQSWYRYLGIASFVLIFLIVFCKELGNIFADVPYHILYSTYGICWIHYFFLFQCPSPEPKQWWQKGPIYRIDIKKFRDSDNDAVGDLAGIRQSL
jgi:hypothetical protein